MAERTVKWTHGAHKQRLQIMCYWKDQTNSTEYCMQILRKSSYLPELISRRPEAFKTTNIEGVHEVAMGQFCILYRISEDIVYILAFLDNRHDPEEPHNSL